LRRAERRISDLESDLARSKASIAAEHTEIGRAYNQGSLDLIDVRRDRDDSYRKLALVESELSKVFF
jgi:hypothetical protein